MFTIDTKNKRVVIAHRVQAIDGRVDLTTTFDLYDVPVEKILLWAATNRLTRWLDSLETNRFTSAEVKTRFDNLVIECREYFQSSARPVSPEQRTMLADLQKLMQDGASMERVLQSLVRKTIQLGH